MSVFVGSSLLGSSSSSSDYMAKFVPIPQSRQPIRPLGRSGRESSHPFHTPIGEPSLRPPNKVVCKWYPLHNGPPCSLCAFVRILMIHPPLPLFKSMPQRRLVHRSHRIALPILSNSRKSRRSHHTCSISYSPHPSPRLLVYLVFTSNPVLLC